MKRARTPGVAALVVATSLIPPAALAAIAMIGCSSSPPSYVGESVTVTDSFTNPIFGPFDGGVHTPYVTGSTVTLVVSPTAGQDLTGWTVVSANPSVMRVTSQIHTSTITNVTSFDGGTTPTTQSIATLAAVAPGSATLAVANPDGKPVENTPVTVVTPDQVKFYAAGDILAGSQLADLGGANVVSGGTATFLVRYFANGAEVYGSGALQATPTAGITATTTTAAASPGNDFLFVTASQSGSIAMSVAGTGMGQLPVVAVPTDAVTGLDLISNNGTSGQGLGVIYARATNVAAERVYGVSVDWQIKGRTLDTTTLDPTGGPTDLFFYPVDSSGTATLMASYEKLGVSASVHANTQYVGSTAYSPHLVPPNTCSVGGAVGAPRPARFALLLALGVLVASRRRRQAAARA